MRSGRARTLAATFVAVALVSCGGGGADGSPSGTVSSANALMTWSPQPQAPPGEAAPSTTVMSALVIGTLRVEVERACVLLEQQGGALLVVWPSGTTWSGDSDTIRMADGTQVRSGRRIRGGGGYVDLDTAGRFIGRPVDDPARCGAADGVAVFNPGGPVDVEGP